MSEATHMSKRIYLSGYNMECENRMVMGEVLERKRTRGVLEEVTPAGSKRRR